MESIFSIIIYHILNKIIINHLSYLELKIHLKKLLFNLKKESIANQKKVLHKILSL